MSALIEGRGPHFEVVTGGGGPGSPPGVIPRWTFEYEPARELVERHIQGRTLNACAGKTKLRHPDDVVRNDLNPERDAETHFDVAALDEHFREGSFDSVVFDPPFDQEQAEDKYEGLHAGDYYGALEAFDVLVGAGGRVITFGWNSFGMQAFDDFERTHVYLLQRSPCHRDIIVTVDERTQYSLTDDWGRSP